MDLPDCPPGAEGYEDSVIEMPKKISSEETTETKAEQEFFEHINSLKIQIENGEARPFVERRGRDMSGKWIYLCYPCAAVCSGESVLQTHISGKKHKMKLSMKNVWPMSIFNEHPVLLSEKSGNKGGGEEGIYYKKPSDLDSKYNKFPDQAAHIQESLDGVKAPLVGVEYLVEHPPEEVHREPAYICTLCNKQGHPRTIINHLTCFWHRYNYILRHYGKATALLNPYKVQTKYREAVGIIINKLAQRIEDKYGRLKPVIIEKAHYDKEKDGIHQWIFKGYHFSETNGVTFEEVIDNDLIDSIIDNEGNRNKRDPSPPVVAAPTKPMFNPYSKPSGRQQRRAGSLECLSDISDEGSNLKNVWDSRAIRKPEQHQARFEPYRKMNENSTQSRYGTNKITSDKTQKPQNYEYKIKLVNAQQKAAEEAANKVLAYHEKNPEKHPLYPEEWKKFWNRRYKEIQAEGKDPSKHDFKPEWIVFWTARMKELHDQELFVVVNEIYRKMCLSPPADLMARNESGKMAEDSGRRSPDTRRRSPEARRRSPEARRRSPDPRRRSPGPGRRPPEQRRPFPRRMSPEPRRRSPDLRRRSPIPRRRSPDLKRLSPDPRRRLPQPDLRRRSPEPRHTKSPDRRPRRPDDRYRSPGRQRPDYQSSSSRSMHRTRSRSPLRGGSRADSPLSQREAVMPMRNRSRSPRVAPSMQTVLISDEELKPDGGASPWNSDNDLDSLGSLPEMKSPARDSRAGSEISRASRPRHYARPAEPSDLGPPENVVATLRLLVALEDYLGSIGPKIVDLLTETLKMEKDKANSSEEILVRESAVVLLETAKEKLKGAVQAGLVAPAAAGAVRSAVVRTAATLHEADNRSRKLKELSQPMPRKRVRRRGRRRRPADQSTSMGKGQAAPMPVAGVGEVDRAQIAQQMAAALIAQGKTDVSSEELSQLVDAVVGMAEAKKREAVKMEVKPPQAAPVAPKAAAKTSSASALQLLQSAYDENDKKLEKDETPDAMDGLSDSDLETLLKNFNELSAEEQHSLIAYLKKLEAREPLRVEKLRQYVSSPAAGEEPPKPAEVIKTVTIESDDDDYAVEEVFQSATQKVKENQIRQEMEIVKKSLEESNTVPAPTETASPALARFSMNMSSASDLLALVQASIQSSAPPIADVVSATTQPRSFGDAQETSTNQPEQTKPLLNTPLPLVPQIEQLGRTSDGIHSPNMGGIQGNWNPRPNQNMPDRPLTHDNREPLMQDRGPYQENRGSYGQDNSAAHMQDSRALSMQDNRGPLMHDNRRPHMQDNRGPLMQDNRGPPMQDIRGPLMQDNRGLMQDNRGPLMQDNRGSLMHDNRGPPMQDNRGPLIQDNRGPSMQDNRGPPMQDNRGPPMQDNRGPPMQDNRGPPMQDNRGPPIQDNRVSYMQDTRGQSMQDIRIPPPLIQDDRDIQDNRMGSYAQDNRGPLSQDNRGTYMQDNRNTYMPDNRNMQNNNRMSAQSNFQQKMGNEPLQNNSGPMQNNMQGNRGPPMQGGNRMHENRGGPHRGAGNFGQNQGPRNNYMNGRTQDNYQQQDQQQFGNQQKPFRGRGRGQYGGQGRGRGRGGYY